MKNYILHVLILFNSYIFSQEYIELPNGDFNWEHNLIPFEDGSYAISVNNWDKSRAYMYSDKGQLISSKKFKSDVRFDNDSGITGLTCWINQSIVDQANKLCYIVKVSKKKFSLLVMNHQFEEESFELDKGDVPISYDDEYKMFISKEGKFYWVSWAKTLKIGQTRDVAIVCFDPKIKKLDIKKTSLNLNDHVYFDFLGFIDGKAFFGGMKKPGVVDEVIIKVYTLEGLDLKSAFDLPIPLENNMKPLYICGIYADSKNTGELSFALGISLMDGPLNEVSHGYNFIQLSSEKDVRIVSWFPEGLKTSGKVPMISNQLNDSLERILIKGSDNGIFLEINYENESYSDPVSIKSTVDIDEVYFWNFFLNKESFSTEAKQAFNKIINPNNSDELALYENPHIFQNNNGHWVIIRCYGKEGRKLEITKN